MQNFELDITNKRVIPLLYAKQRDVGAKIHVVLTDNKEPYTVPNDVQFSVWFSGKSGSGNYTEIDGKSAFVVEGNTITVELIHQMLNNAGEHAMCLVMNDASGNQRGMWNIPYFVEEIPGADSEAATAYYNAFLDAQKKAEEAADRAETAATEADLSAEEAAVAKFNAQSFSNQAWEAKRQADIAADRAEAATADAVLFTPQTITKEQQAQARDNTNALSKASIAVDYAPPSDTEAKVWLNPNGTVGGALKKEDGVASSVAGIVGLALNEMLNSTAARYATIANALAGSSATADGKVLAYTFGGKLNIMLLDDIASSSTISVNKDCTLHLNGKTLSFTASGAYLNITTASEVTINGNVAGSKIVKSGITSSAAEKLVSATGTHLIITGGTYEMTGMTSKSAIPIRTESATTKIDMDGCTVLAYGLGSTKVKAVQTDLLTARNCMFDASSVSEAAQTLALFGDTQVYDSTINAVSTGGNAHGAVISDGKNLTITNCHIEADGRGGDVATCAVACGDADVIINGGYYYGAREAISIQGTSTAHINGGVFEGCQHGGGYFSSSTAKVKNATFRNIEYTGDCGWNTSHFGAVYCGSTSINDINVSFDNCRFESKVRAAHGITAKETNTEVFLSNCVIDGNFKDDLRADKTCTIYIGENVAYETIGQPTADNAVSFHGTIDTTTYADQAFGFETETVIPIALLSVKDERGNWIAIA